MTPLTTSHVSHTNHPWIAYLNPKPPSYRNHCPFPSSSTAYDIDGFDHSIKSGVRTTTLRPRRNMHQERVVSTSAALPMSISIEHPSIRRHTFASPNPSTQLSLRASMLDFLRARVKTSVKHPTTSNNKPMTYETRHSTCSHSTA